MSFEPSRTPTQTSTRTLNGWGYSPLDQINRENVGELRLVWLRALTSGSQQGTPLVHDGVMYMPNPGDVVQAIASRMTRACVRPGSFWT